VIHSLLNSSSREAGAITLPIQFALSSHAGMLCNIAGDGNTRIYAACHPVQPADFCKIAELLRMPAGIYLCSMTAWRSDLSCCSSVEMASLYAQLAWWRSLDGNELSAAQRPARIMVAEMENLIRNLNAPDPKEK